MHGRTAHWFTGHFDPLLAEHAALLHQAASDGNVLIVEIANPPQPLLPQRARAELVAALADVNYVVMTDREAPAPDIAITRRFIQQVRERSNGAKP
jgi:bifunctional ADP-heptose synthase (sugar kinase/adenylyltransferase)